MGLKFPVIVSTLWRPLQGPSNLGWGSEQRKLLRGLPQEESWKNLSWELRMIFFKLTKRDWRDYLRSLTALTETLSFLSSTRNGWLTTACDSNSRAPGADFLWAPECTWMHMQAYTHPHINTNKSWKDFAREWRWELRIFFDTESWKR